MWGQTWQGRGELNLLLATSGSGETFTLWMLSRCGAHSAFLEGMQVQGGRRFLLALWWPLGFLPHSTEGWQQPRDERDPEESQEVCGNGLSLAAQRSSRRGMFSGAGEAQCFSQRFQVCGCPQVNSKGSVEKADQFLEGQQGHWGQTR